MIAALIITSTVVATSQVEARGQSVQWTYHGASGVNTNYPVLSPNGDVFVYSTNGFIATVYAISPEGKDLWNTSVYLSGMPQFAADGTVYLHVETSTTSSVNGSGLKVLSPSGSAKWTYAIPGISIGFVVMSDGSVVIGMEPVYPGQYSLVCLNSDGTVRWTVGAYEINGLNHMMYPVAVHGNNVLVASTSFTSPGASVITEYAPDGRVVRSFATTFAPNIIYFAFDGTMRTVGYNYDYLYALTENGTFMWATQLNNNYADLIILQDGTTIYWQVTGSTSLNVDVYAVDSKGVSLWRSVNAKSFPVAFGNGALIANSTALMLVDKDGTVQWKLDGSYGGWPVVNGKTILISSGNDLVAISESTWKITWQPAVMLATIMAAFIGFFLLTGKPANDF